MKTIFVVDDNNVNLLTADEALSPFYRIFTLPSAKGMFELLAEEIIPDMILLDILMPEIDGFEALILLKSNSKWGFIPVIFLTSRSDSSTESIGFDLGAVDFISKPFSKPVLLNRIKTHLNIEDIILERTRTLSKIRNGIVFVLSSIVESRDKMTVGHIDRLTRYIKIFTDKMLERKVYYDEVSQWNLDMVLLAVRMHDIGKITVTDIILNKPGTLTTDEYTNVKSHMLAGEKIINNIISEAGDDLFLQYAKTFAAHHHERWDGTGCPCGLKGIDIPLLGRIMAVADVYDALISDRPYKSAFPHAHAVEAIRNGSGTQFDPELVKIFLDNEQDFLYASIE